MYLPVCECPNTGIEHRDQKMRSRGRVSAALTAVKFFNARHRPQIGLYRRKLVGLTTSEFGVLRVELEISD